MLKPYTKEVEQLMKDFFNSLSEKDKRRYAAVEAEVVIEFLKKRR